LVSSGSIRFNQQFPSLVKTLRLFEATLAILGLVVVPISAQTQSTTVQVSKLVGTKVKSSQGEEIGVIKDVMIDRSTGCMAYTVLSTGDGGETRAAGGGKLVAVPWAVYSPASDVNVLTVTVDRGRIYSAPVFDYARIDEYSRPDYITNVYGYYGVSSGAEVGTSRTTTTGATTEATSGARAAGSPPAGGVSPAAKPSPAATRSPVERESPAGKASPRPHATASPHARGEASATPSSRREREPGTRGRPEETESPSSRTKEGRGTKARPEETEPPSGGAELQREPSEATRESPSDATNSGEKTSEGNQKRPHRKPERREANTPPPEGGGEQQ
jgi:sporulation protein YlmC with PRC-barrel domain